MSVFLHEGDCLEILKTLPSESIDSVITDPPAGISFMGKGWDSDKGGRDHWITWMAEIAAECLRVIKPGGHALVWALPRTSHWTATAWENAGWAVRDRIAHLFGTGFPKSTNHLKPACEDWWLLRKPLIGSVAVNVLAHGTGALNIDDCRIGTELRTYKSSAMPGGNSQRPHGGDGRDAENAKKYGEQSRNRPSTTIEGRWPANVTTDGSDEVLEAFAAFGEKTSGKASANGHKRVTSLHDTDAGWGMRHSGSAGVLFGDTGTAARFYYAAKASKSERSGSKHPTVKPVSLMRYLCRLVTPKNGIILDPFAGTGSTGQAAVDEGFSAILIEQEPGYCATIRCRLALWLTPMPDPTVSPHQTPSAPSSGASPDNLPDTSSRPHGNGRLSTLSSCHGEHSPDPIQAVQPPAFPPACPSGILLP